ncbi:hypothetical protein G3I40_13700 [Streptomyces sp. SID14478]|uniref:hypothetical protein n=1 Tax=Streptomyces sp. SID14478 TaxID=2706073 RepID=UPI0013DC5965|nr:hypothetical protein [Streptomyces sp. SID14478]NEB76269.1 hypothetical protein [Streptomyces sp. SID14478]
MTALTTASQYPAALPLGLCVLVGALAAFGLAGFGFSTLSAERRTEGPAALARGAAALSAAAAAALYVWGAVHLFLDETGTAQACRSAGGAGQFGAVDRYGVSYLPPSLQCHLTGGGSYEAAVPGYVTPALTGLAVVAVTLTALAVLESARSARRPANKEKKL